jgi:acyl-coenzyme A synthetase/AMP-(fatty) acid ligase/surfactin synthase thioesterase subunit/acyl carrier protein
MTRRTASDTVFARFASIAAKHRAAPAFTESGRTVSFGELHDRALAAEKEIGAFGRAKAGLVGILTRDRVTAMIGMLGVAASGHAYVLLDADDPDERLKRIIADSAPFSLLADSGLTERARSLAPAGASVIDLDRLTPSRSRAKPSIEVTGDSLLYVSFTSGSTGVPKGVCQSHRNLIFFVDRYIETMQIEAGDPISWLFAHGVSASNMDIYGALFTGAKLCAFDLKTQSFAAMADWIDAECLTLLHTVPTVARELSGAIADKRMFGTVDVVDLAGEMLFSSDVAKLRPHFRKDCMILNRLAATEASFIAAMDVSRAQARRKGALPVGKPPRNVEISIVDSDALPVSNGKEGYIAIASPHVALGYLDPSDPNQAAFSDIEARPGWRRFTSADLGLIDDGGNLNFIGRSGSRIKLHGQAVDLAEIEAALCNCPGVRGAIVLAEHGEGEEARAVNAFLTLADGVERETGPIRKALLERLPASMLPSGYIFLDQFPQTATSKVDRKALGVMDVSALRYRPGYQPPENQTEERVAAIYAQVLGIAGVGRFDDFFDLGGDSLSLVNLQILATEAFGRQFSELNRDASVKGVAAWLAEQPSGGAMHTSILLAIRTEGSAPPLFVVHGRRGQAHVSTRFLDLLGPEQPLYVLQARGFDGKEEPHHTIEEMAADYLAAIREVQPKGPYFIGGFCAGSYIAIEMIHLIREAGETYLRPLLIDPPVPNFGKSDDEEAEEYKSEEFLEELLRYRVAEGQWKVDLENASAVANAIKVAQAVESALSRFQRRPISVPVAILATKPRWRNFQNVWAIFGRNCLVYLLDHVHGLMLSPDNQAFAAALRHCLDRVAKAAEQAKRG